MSTNYHTPHSTGFDLDADEFNAVYSDLDTQITANSGDITTLQASISAVDASAQAPACRLTLAANTPFPTTDQTAKTTLRLTRYNGQYIPIYTGSAWALRSIPSGDVTVAVPSTTSTVYDVFAYWTGSAIALELVAWASATARSTGIVLQDGYWTKDGDETRLYVGTFRTTTASGETEDSIGKRLVWNMFHRRPRRLKVVDTTDSWAYSTAAWRQARASTANQVEYVVGLSEDVVKATTRALVNAASGAVSSGVGVDSTSANSAGVYPGVTGNTSVAQAEYSGYPGIGYHYLAWLEYGGTAATWYGDAGVAYFQSGMTAEVWA